MVRLHRFVQGVLPLIIAMPVMAQGTPSTAPPPPPPPPPAPATQPEAAPTPPQTDTTPPPAQPPAAVQSAEPPSETPTEPAPRPPLLTVPEFKLGAPDFSLPAAGSPGDDGFSTGDTPTSTINELDDILTPRRGVFHLQELEAPLDEVVRALLDFEQSTGLRFGMAYTMLFQQATGGPGKRSGGAGDLDFMTSWTLLGRGTQDTGTLVFTFEYRFQIGEQPPSFLGRSLGTLTNVTGAFNDRGWVVRDAYWIQRLFEGRVRILAGRADPSDFSGGTRMQNVNNSFFNRAFSANPVVAYPNGHGPTVGISVAPTDLFYATFGASNAYSSTTTSGLDTLDEWDLFTFCEFGFTPEIDGLGRGRYRVMLWHMDARSENNLPSDQGISVILEQDFGTDVLAFLRYGYSDANLTNIQNMVSGGVGVRGLLGSADNLTGLAASWAEPPGAGARDEKVVEVFQRWQLTKRTQFTLGAQLIVDPSNSPNDDALGVFSARFRIDF